MNYLINLPILNMNICLININFILYIYSKLMIIRLTKRNIKQFHSIISFISDLLILLKTFYKDITFIFRLPIKFIFYLIKMLLSLIISLKLYMYVIHNFNIYKVLVYYIIKIIYLIYYIQY